MDFQECRFALGIESRLRPFMRFLRRCLPYRVKGQPLSQTLKEVLSANDAF